MGYTTIQMFFKSRYDTKLTAYNFTNLAAFPLDKISIEKIIKQL